jgi:MarR family 2-MHQ and catechol resistance regulon transcriptional repressor
MADFDSGEWRLTQVASVSEFLVLDNGLLADKRARKLSAWYAGRGHVRDPMAIEVNWLAIHVGHEVLEAGRPHEPVMSFARYTILRDLFMADDYRLSMSRLGHLLHVALANITKLVDGLVEAGYVERIEDTADKRKTWAKLTPEGRHFMSEMLPRTARQVERNWSSLSTDEKRLLIHLLAKVRLSLQIQSASERFIGVEEVD